MGKNWIKDMVLNPESLDDINTVIANCEIEIGNTPSKLIPVFKEYFPTAKIDWNVGCTRFWINGVKYGMHLDYYWMNKGPMFFKER